MTRGARPPQSRDAGTRGRRGDPKSDRRGVVLLVVLAVLIVLSLIATFFATLSSVEQQLSRSYLDDVRARLLAQNGVDYAVERISAATLRGMPMEFSMTYWGTATDEVSGIPDPATPLEHAVNPSYAWEAEPVQNPDDALRTPRIFRLDGEPAGISGVCSSTYAPNSDVYRLRVTDANSLLHLNDGAENGPTGNVSRNLVRLVDNLCVALGLPDRPGQRIVDRRPAGGYRSKRDLEAVVGSALYAKLQPFVTMHAWIDRSVVNPVPLSREALGPGRTGRKPYAVPYNEQIGCFRFGRSQDSMGRPVPFRLLFIPEFEPYTDGTASSVYALDELNAQWIERTARAPVNVNLAPREILVALLLGLQGWYVVERRRRNPSTDMYGFLQYPVLQNARNGARGDEWGFLYSTLEIDLNAAGRIADEILACRARRRSPQPGGSDYSSSAVWYAGPFRSWRQFHAFCDGLVPSRILADTRAIFYDCTLSPIGTPTGNSTLAASPPAIQPRQAAQAIADVLKANFNPNSTLNELNPDEALHLLVDKTDLIRNSTEFCFTPMGTFEIESEGLVLRTPGNRDLMQTGEASILARRKVSCLVRAFEALRETTQADFHGGTPRPRVTDPVTNNDRTMEIGPEPDNGIAPQECRWSGWMQLSTLGGLSRRVESFPERTPRGGPERGAVLCGHFALDHRLSYHAGGGEDPLGGGGGFLNRPDRSEGTLPGPYGPTTPAPPAAPQEPGKPYGRYRLARDWVLAGDPPKPEPAWLAGTTASPDSRYCAPSDLRLDGAYVERDSALMYRADASVLGDAGTFTAWIKPSFHPERTGKPRAFFCLDPIKPPRYRFPYAPILGLWFFASQGAIEGGMMRYASGPFRERSLVAGFSTNGGIGGGVGECTPSLHHRWHPDEGRKPDLLAAHRWTHMAFHWDMIRQRVEIHVNGGAVKDMGSVRVHPVKMDASTFLAGGNPLRFGDASGGKPRNWTADATMDEIHLWKGNQLRTAGDLYALGRYYIPRPGFEAGFVSDRIAFGETARRILPPCAPSPGAGTTVASAPATPVQVMSISWTAHTESVAAGGGAGPPSGTPLVRDANRNVDLAVLITAELRVNGTTAVSGLIDEAGAPIPTLYVRPEDDLRYALRIEMPQARLDTILLTTPAIDDVTILFSRGVQFLSYERSAS